MMTNSEQITALISSKFFLKQFIYSDIYVKTGTQEEEFCDCLLEFSNLYICIQIKERDETSTTSSYSWFENKVLKKAKKQIRNTYKHYTNTDNIIFSKSSNLSIDRTKTFVPIIIFKNDDLTAYDRVVISQSLKITINIFSFTDFETMLKTVVLPYDIIHYLEYRTIFKNDDSGKIFFDNVNDECTIISRPKNETDFSELFLVRTYYSAIIKENVSEENIKFYNDIINQLNEMTQGQNKQFILGLLNVNYVIANQISIKWQEFVEKAQKNIFVTPFYFSIEDREYMFFVKPKTMSEKDFDIRFSLCLVYHKYKFGANTAHILSFSAEENEQYSVSIGDINLNTDIPYEEMLNAAINVFEGD